MKTVSAFTETAIDNPHVEPIRLLEITIGSTTLYLCDRVFGDDGDCTYNSQMYEPLVISWGTIKTGRIDPITLESRPGEATITIDNSKSVGGADFFSKLFASDDPQYGTVEIYDIFGGASAADDKNDIFAGNIEDILEMTAARVTLACSGVELDIANRFDHTIVDTITYPGADPDDIGKMVPQIYGNVKRSPCIAADAGGRTTIAEEMTASSPGNSGTLEFTDASTFPASGAFTVQIDDEQIRIASRSANTCTLAASGARGYASTDAVPHDNGSAVSEIQTEYVYLAADHPVKTIDEIYVDDVKQESGYTAYTGQSGDEYGGYSGKAVIVFSTLPLLKKQVNADINSDSRLTSDSGHVHSIGGSTATLTAEFQTHTVTCGTVGNPANVYDGSSATQAYFSGATAGNPAKLHVKRTADLSGTSGTPKRWRIGCHTGALLGYNVNGYGLNGSYQFPSTDNTLLYSPWYNVATQTWAYVNSKLKATNWCWVNTTDVGTSYKYIRRYFIQIEYETEASPTDTGIAAVTISGSNVLSGNTTAETVIGKRIGVDCGGYLDDGSGTYTGTPNALIERPDHICKHILIDRCGKTTDEIDSTSYTAAGSFYSTNSYVLGFSILQRPNVRSLLNRIAFQSKTISTWDSGKHFLLVITGVTADKTIGIGRIDQGQVYLKYTDRINIQNKITGRYDRRWSGYDDRIESDQAIVISSDSGSITIYGTLQGEPLSLAYITAEGQAQDIVDWRIDDLKLPRLIVEFSGGYYMEDIEKGDLIDFADETEIDQVLLGLVTLESDLFRVTDKTYRPDASIQIEVIRI